MPGFLTTVASPVLCAHAGQAKPPVGALRVRAMGQPLAIRTIPFLVAGCVNPVPPVNVGPCVSANWILSSLRIKSMGIPVLLQDSQAICVPTGTPLTQIPVPGRVKGF